MHLANSTCVSVWYACLQCLIICLGKYYIIEGKVRDFLAGA